MEIYQTNTENFSNLFSRHYESLYSLAFKLSGNRQNAEDIVQEAFLKAFSGWDSFRGEASGYTWLYKITLHCSYRYMTRIKKLPVQYLAENQGTDEAAVFRSLPVTKESEDPLLASELRERCLNGFMRCLPARQRIAFTLRAILGLSVKETADIMETSENNVKTLSFRARNFMKDLMENRCSFLNPENPCRCQIWVVFALEQGIISTEEARRVRPQAVSPAFDKEVDILHRIKVLHRLARPNAEYDEFYSQVKKLMAEKNLKILS